MNNFFNLRLEKINLELKQSSAKGSGHPTDVATEREKIFRKFLTDLFPYYNSFKGNVYGKSCDFVLAPNQDHPNFDSIDEQYYAHVLTSAVDTIIDLKGDYSKKQLLDGINQAKTIKSFQRSNRGQRNVTKDWKFAINGWADMTMRHGIVFMSGDHKIITNELINYLRETNVSDTVINAQKIERFYKLPDFILILSTNELIYIDKCHTFSGTNPQISISTFKKGISTFAMLIELFSNERDNMKERKYIQLYWWNNKDETTSFQNQTIFNFDADLSWLTSEYKNKYDDFPKDVSKLIDILNLLK